MKQLLSALTMALTHLPTVLAAVKGVEDTLGSGNGETKKELVLNCLTAAAAAGETSTAPAVQAISTLVDLTVATLNKSGVFKTTPK